jgi:hypothetical protein
VTWSLASKLNELRGRPAPSANATQPAVLYPHGPPLRLSDLRAQTVRQRGMAALGLRSWSATDGAAVA